MLPQSVHTEQKNALINAAVKAVATDGLESLTTKTIGLLSGVKEVYIYRYFADKEDLVSKAFALADEALLSFALESIPDINYTDKTFELYCTAFFKSLWDYISAHPDWLVFYIRYYYSQSFQLYSYAEHIKRYEIFVKKLQLQCEQLTVTKALCRYVFNTLLIQAEELLLHSADYDITWDGIFKMLFSAVKSEIKW